jgi:hypothetical protein
MSKRSEIKIRSLSDEINEMTKLGLWPREIPIPDPQLVERIHRLEEEIYNRTLELFIPDSDIRAKQLDRVRKDYVNSIKEKKIERKKHEISEKLQKRDHWKNLQQSNFTHLGKNVSTTLNERQENSELLTKLGIPSFPNADALADFLGITVPEIKWLAYHRTTGKTYHYYDFLIPKKTKGFRYISKPRPRLFLVQKLIKEEILDKMSWNKEVFGFIKGKSIYDHALYHKKPKLIVNVDIKNFFHSINYFQIRSIFKRLGYSGEISSVLALLTTKQQAKKVNVNGIEYYSFSNHRYLPQGACTSPSLSNLAASKLDLQLLKRSKSLGFKYSRYVDDLTFSVTKKKAKVKTLLYMIMKTLELHGFQANPSKTRVLGPNRSQQITGLVVNSGQPKIPRKWRRQLRASIHQFLNIQDEETKLTVLPKLHGKIEYLRLSHPSDAEKYLKKIIP